MGADPKVGERMAFDISDLGRVYLGGLVGPEIDQIEGRLLEAPNGGFDIGVIAVKNLRGDVQVWSGEKLHLEKDHVARVYERKFSRGRTAVRSLIAVAGVIAVFGKDLGVVGGANKPVPPIDTFPTFVPRP